MLKVTMQAYPSRAMDEAKKLKNKEITEDRVELLEKIKSNRRCC